MDGSGRLGSEGGARLIVSTPSAASADVAAPSAPPAVVGNGNAMVAAPAACSCGCCLLLLLWLWLRFLQLLLLQLGLLRLQLSFCSDWGCIWEFAPADIVGYERI